MGANPDESQHQPAGEQGARTKWPLQPAPGRIADLAWLAGEWSLDKGEDHFQEAWSQPVAGMMLGTFCWVKSKEVSFYELITIEPEWETLVYRIKHFHAGGKGWEEKDEAVAFVLVSQAADQVVFLRRNADNPQWVVSRKRGTGVLWLVYRKTGEAEMLSYFDSPQGDPAAEDMLLYHRR